MPKVDRRLKSHLRTINSATCIIALHPLLVYNTDTLSREDSYTDNNNYKQFT